MPDSPPIQQDFALEPDGTQRLANLCGPFDEHLRQIELRLGGHLRPAECVPDRHSAALRWRDIS